MTGALAQRRSLLLYGALAAAVAASLWAVLAPADDVPEVSPAPLPLALADTAAADTVRPPATDAAVSAPPASAGSERRSSAPRDDIFTAYSWEPPRPVAPAVREAPQAPPVPFVFSGRLEAGGMSSYILAEGGRMHVVAVGQQVGEFRLQQASDASLEFVHVPSNLPATLSILK